MFVQAEAISPSLQRETAALHRWANASAQFTSRGAMARRMSNVPFSREVSKTSAVSMGDWERENCCWRMGAERWWRADATVLRWLMRDIVVKENRIGDDLQPGDEIPQLGTLYVLSIYAVIVDCVSFHISCSIIRYVVYWLTSVRFLFMRQHRYIPFSISRIASLAPRLNHFF
jgi:hypothetical protein